MTDSPLEDRRFRVLGVAITDVTTQRAIGLVEEIIRRGDGRTRSVFFANAHTLNVAARDERFREVLNQADFVLGDGTGLRWAARLHGIRMKDNLVGTDMVPALFRATADRGYSYFLLGADERTIRRAAANAARDFPGWTQAGYHHGYLGDRKLADGVIDRVNAARPDVLLVGKGNPLQEFWIDRHANLLSVRVCMGVGGLFDYWARNVTRAPRLLRRLGHEWMWRVYQQPRDKAKRYLLGNPLFVWRVLRERVGGERFCQDGSPRRAPLGRSGERLGLCASARVEPTDRAYCDSGSLQCQLEAIGDAPINAERSRAPHRRGATEGET